jgi:hypothetical protein
MIKMQNVGTGMLEDGLFSTGKWLSNPANQAIAVKFISPLEAGSTAATAGRLREHHAPVRMTLRRVIRPGRWARSTG